MYTAGTDGSLRSWHLDKVKGTMVQAAVVEGAHKGRICALVRGHTGFLYSCGVEGIIMMWNESLELLTKVRISERDSMLPATCGRGLPGCP